MTRDLIAEASERGAGMPLLERFMEDGRLTRREALPELRARAEHNLAALPVALRRPSAAERSPYPVRYSELLLSLARA